jgi:hypothetical protein
MKLNGILLFLNILFVNTTKMIKNFHLPACKNCIHFKPKYLSDYCSPYSKCEKFGEKNIINNEITYHYVDSCRTDELKCGEIGTYFENDNNIKFKILRHKFINNIHYFILFIIIIILKT